MVQMDEPITFEQLADHNNLSSLWIAVRGQVYDLTTFGYDHPGGIEALTSCAGTDGTESYEYAAHSEANTAKMQQYRVGKLQGSESFEETAPHSHDFLSVERKRARSVVSYLKRLRFSPNWTKMAVAVSVISVISLAMLLAYQRMRRFDDYILPTLNFVQPQFDSVSHQKVGWAFWAGMTVASSVSCVAFGYLYRLFLSSLDYQNDVFSFPATIPRKRAR